MLFRLRQLISLKIAALLAAGFVLLSAGYALLVAPNQNVAFQTNKASGSAGNTRPASAATTTPAQAVASTPAPAPTAASAKPKTAASTTTVTPARPTAPSCTKASFTPASGITPSSAGLTQDIVSPQTYQVYGYTANDIRSEINQCHASLGGTSGDFDSYTSWWVTYNYYYAFSGSVCYLYNVSVGLQVKMIFPHWDPSQYDDAGLSSRWAIYIANLTTHENGHKDLSVQYANTLLNSLNSFTQPSCSDMANQTNAMGSGILAQLNQAQDNYDAQTNHGATQGAVFP